MCNFHLVSHLTFLVDIDGVILKTNTLFSFTVAILHVIAEDTSCVTKA